MPLNRQDLVHAAASVTGATGAAVVARACATARTGAGVYTVTVGDVDATECICLANLRGVTDGRVVVAQTSDTVKTVSTFNAAGAATDLDFDFLCLRIASGSLN